MLACFSCPAQKDSLVIENQSISRKIYFRKDSAGIYSTSFLNKKTGQNYINPGTEEFAISINDSLIEGKNCRYLDHIFFQDHDTQRLSIRLSTPFEKIYIRLVYEIYKDLPLIRKQLVVVNESRSAVSLTDLDVEKLRFQVINKFDNEVYSAYGTNLNRIPYKGDYNDAAIVLYNRAASEGAVLGNEAPGVLKNTEIYTRIHGCIQMGMRHHEENFPFKKQLGPGAEFKSPKTFIYVFHSNRWQYGFENDYKVFLNNYLGIHLFQKSSPPLVLFDTWLPFLDNINENLLKQCAGHLQNTGTDLFVIDAGWYRYSGDFLEDSSKFPSGMKALADTIRARGMRVGLWFPAASVNLKSQVAMAHPEWLVKDKNGKPANLHDMSVSKDGPAWSDALVTMSLASPYYDHLRSIVRSYIHQLNLSYVKFDLSMISSAYVHDPERTGDYDSNPSKIYQDRSSSYWETYECMMQLMDDLHREFPQLLIDCTFEVWGRYNLADYALLEHADYDWLTNFQQSPPDGPISIRQMAFDRSRVLPPSTLLIGNQSLNFSNYQYVYYSLAASSLVYVGDPRSVPGNQMKFYRRWNDYLKKIEAKYKYSRYYQLYDVFERPGFSNWDGCFRINPEKQGGLMFFFRNNSPDSSRRFRVPCLNEQYKYRIYSFESNKTIGIYSGKTLMEDGLPITLSQTYSGVILTIEKI
ncbi:MAG: alpha-galactosidase [Flavisolibacter sp.]